MGTRIAKRKVELSAEQREQLQALLRKSSLPGGEHRRARVLLFSDCNHPEGRRSDASIGELVGLSEKQVKRIRTQFVEELGERSLDDFCARKPHPPAPHRRRLDGEAEAQLVVLACGDPPEGRNRWTLQLLCDELARLKVVESVCPETVRKSLKKTSCSLGE